MAMNVCSYQVNQLIILKKGCIRYHEAAHFGNPMQREFFNCNPMKGLYPCLKCPTGKGSDFFHDGPIGANGNFDF